MKADKIIEINEEKIKQHLGEFVRGTVEETLNTLLDAEADAICNAQKYEHSTGKKRYPGWAIMRGNFKQRQEK